MKTKINCTRGISIIETLVSLSILVGVALTSSFILTNTNVVRKREEVKATIDQIHVLQVQRARRSDILKYTDAPVNLNERLTPEQRTCFNGSRAGYNNTGIDCNVTGISGIPTASDWTGSLVLAGFDNANFGMFGEANLFETEARWKATCPNGTRCTSVEVRITTRVRAGSSMTQGGARLLEPRVTVVSFPAQFFQDQVAIRFICTTPVAFINPVAFTVNNRFNRADCTPVSVPAETACATQYPIHNFGDVVTAAPVPVCNMPANTSCGGGSEGYRRINFGLKECRNR